MTWAATQAKAKFSEVLDKAEMEGPQIVRRRKQEFYVLTRAQHDATRSQSHPENKPPVNGWDALAPSSGLKFDLRIPRRKGRLKASSF